MVGIAEGEHLMSDAIEPEVQEQVEAGSCKVYRFYPVFSEKQGRWRYEFQWKWDNFKRWHPSVMMDVDSAALHAKRLGMELPPIPNKEFPPK